MRLPLPQGEVAIAFRGLRQPEILLSLHVQDGGPAEQPKLQIQTAVQFGETILHRDLVDAGNRGVLPHGSVTDNQNGVRFNCLC